MWKGVHERLFLHESDAEDFINSPTIYDMVFIDAYDGGDIFHTGTISISLEEPATPRAYDCGGEPPTSWNRMVLSSPFFNQLCRWGLQYITEVVCLFDDLHFV